MDMPDDDSNPDNGRPGVRIIDGHAHSLNTTELKQLPTDSTSES